MAETSKPKITIDLDPVLEGYCRYLFPPKKEKKKEEDKEEDKKEIAVTRRHPIGQRLTAVTDECRFLKNNPPVKDTVVFVLPVNKVNHYHVTKCFLKINEWEKQKLVDFIRSEFNLWVREEFYRGYEILKWDQKTIAEAILRKLNVRKNAINFDTIIKNDYRNRVYVERMRAELLLKL
jgi:hypothetical protein